MFFVLRIMFWLAVVCILLPSSGDKTANNTSETPSIDTIQAVSAAGATYSDMRGFCERQAAACAIGGQVASVLGHRAQEGAKTIVEFISQQMSDTSGKQATPKPQNTLTSVDVAPAWTGPTAQVPLPPVPPRRDTQNRRPTA
jgi:hypothetical protein